MVGIQKLIQLGMSANKVALYSGCLFDLLNPKIEDIHIPDIAVGLSRIVRFNGQTIKPRSVLEHSISVMCHLEEAGFDKRLQLAGLLHDSTEAYIGDIVNPLKSLLSEINEIERKIKEVIYRKFDILDLIQAHEVHEADMQDLSWEFEHNLIKRDWQSEITQKCNINALNKAQRSYEIARIQPIDWLNYTINRLK
jgi:hypothetical protein